MINLRRKLITTNCMGSEDTHRHDNGLESNLKDENGLDEDALLHFH